MATPNQASNVVHLRRSQPEGQLSLLLPLLVESLIPARFHSADLTYIGRSIDGHDYAIKTTDDHPLLPASEFLCYQLASACNLAVPFSAVMDLADGKLAFGSRFEGGIYEVPTYGPRQQFEALAESANGVSATLAFDLFVGNADRHIGNFLFRKNQAKQWTITGIDFSRAFLVRQFPNDEFPLRPDSHTRKTIALMKDRQLWQGPFAVNSISRLLNVQRGHLEHWFKEMPPEWLSVQDQNTLMEWWQSPAFHKRVTEVLQLL